MARTLKLTVSYDGTRFVGWQRQAEGVSIQGLLEDALARFEGAPVTVHGAGRTDAGVHALGQVASVQLASAHPVDSVARGLNACLPPEVRVVAAEEAAAGFHARFSAVSKTYRYLVRNAPLVTPFERAFVWHVPQALDLEAMQAAARAVVGAHDFSAFSSSAKGGVASRPDTPALTGGDRKATVRTMSRSEIARHAGRTLLDPAGESGAEGATLLAYEIGGDGFLRHMVRAIVGTLVEIGRRQRPAASMAALLAGGSRAEAGATAPPQGLFLVRVDYD